MEKHWCMCTQIGFVRRDGYSICEYCGGKDAYGKSQDRPEDKKKEIHTTKNDAQTHGGDYQHENK